MSKEQLALFEAAWQARGAETQTGAEDDDDLDGDPGAGQKRNETPERKRGGRQALARHLTRERIVHDLAESAKHCSGCGKDLRLIALPALAQAKLSLYCALRTAGIRKSDLARRLGWHKSQVDRLLDLTHSSRMDQIEAAFGALGKQIEVSIRDAA